MVYWNESDEEVERDIQKCIGSEPTVSCVHVHTSNSSLVVVTGSAVVAKVPCGSSHISRPIFKQISEIAKVFPSTLYLRGNHLSDKTSTIPIVHKVVCSNCHSLFNYRDCTERRGTKTVIRNCAECGTRRKQTPLLKSIITSRGTTKFYPFLVYPYCSLISSL